MTLTAGSIFLAMAVASPAFADPLGPWSGSQVALAGATQVWRTQLPLGYTQAIRSYDLVGGYLYALGDDGWIRAVRPDTGEHIWSRPVARPLDALWPPAAGRVAGAPAVVFALLENAVFLDPLTGRELKRLRLDGTTTAGVVASNKHVFQVGPGGHVRCIRIKDGVTEWGVGLPATIAMAPVYRGDADEMVVVADTQGTLIALSSTEHKYFMRSLGQAPSGKLGSDRLAVYVATNDGLLHAIERSTGDLLWHYSMVDRPEGGPVVTATALYQATTGGGLYRFDIAQAASLATRPAAGPPLEDAAGISAAVPDKLPTTDPSNQPQAPAAVHARARIDAARDIRRWYLPAGKKFLAEWPERIVVLQTDGRIALIPRDSVDGQPAELLDLGAVVDAVSNTWNDAVILTSPRGDIRCLRPIGGKPLTPADFGGVPAASQPAASQPAATATGQPGQGGARAATSPAQAGSEVTPPAPRGQDTLLTDPLRSRKAPPPQ